MLSNKKHSHTVDIMLNSMYVNALGLVGTESENRQRTTVNILMFSYSRQLSNEDDPFHESGSSSLTKQKVIAKLSERLKLSRRAKSMSLDHGDSLKSDNFPSFAEVPLGTSIRQQRELFEHELNEIFPHNSESEFELEEHGMLKYFFFFF